MLDVEAPYQGWEQELSSIREANRFLKSWGQLAGFHPKALQRGDDGVQYLASDAVKLSPDTSFLSYIRSLKMLYGSFDPFHLVHTIQPLAQ